MTVPHSAQFSAADPAPGHFWHLRHKAIGIAMLLGALPVLAVGVAAYQIVKFETGKKVENLQERVATGLHNKINIFMRDRYGDIQAMAGLDIFTDAKHRDIATVADKEAALERLLVAYPIYDSIGLFDSNGDVIAQTAGRALGNYSDRPYVREALAKNVPVLSQPVIAPTSGIFSIYSIAPISDKDSGETIGFIRSRVPVSSFAKLISSLGEDKVNQYFLTGRDGNIFLGSEGEYLVPTTPITTAANGDATSEFTTRTLQQFFPELQELQASERAGNVLAASPSTGKEQLITYMPSKSLEGLPELGWGVTLAIDTDVAFAAQQQLLRTLVGGTTLAMILVAFTAAILADRATRPILSATATVTQLRCGQFGARVDVRGKDEVAQLGRNINQMAEYIQLLVAEIESSNAAAVQEQNHLLQADICQILELVYQIKEGNLTVEAETNERETGLVLETLNSLTQDLRRILSAVGSTVQQVNQRTVKVGSVATTTAQRAQTQTQLVKRVQALMENVNILSRDTTLQTVTADTTVQLMQAAVSEGQHELISMTEGISTLQAGAEQITLRSQALTDFVDLAAQFTRDQKRVAALTRVLALNASMLASRASSQQDPQQFAGIVREFETISKQVNDLAVETSHGLSGLKQRSEQVQTVVSGLDHDVREIGNIVGIFAREAGESRQAFERVRKATEQVARVSQQIAQSNQEIAAAAQTTLHSVQEIATNAHDTEQQASLTQEQLGFVEQMVDNLQDLVQFFQLEASPEILPITTTSESHSSNRHALVKNSF